MPAVDIELTNFCNTVCVFCPRDKMPEKGYIDSRTFEQAVGRAQEASERPEMKFCGTGEPLLHPDIAAFVSRLARVGMPPSVSTNAGLLTEEKSRALLDAGLERICFSVSGIYETYEKIHRLSFDKVMGNIERFLTLADDRCETRVSIVRCAENKGEIEGIKDFWKKLGIGKIVIFDYVNRTGKLDLDYDFQKSDRWMKEARRLLSENGLHPFCFGPLVFNFIGWNGSYYLCSNEFGKHLPLGTVFDTGLDAVKTIKMEKMKAGNRACNACDLNVVNQIREIFFRKEKGEDISGEMTETIEKIRNVQEMGSVLL